MKAFNFDVVRFALKAELKILVFIGIGLLAYSFLTKPSSIEIPLEKVELKSSAYRGYELLIEDRGGETFLILKPTHRSGMPLIMFVVLAFASFIRVFVDPKDAYAKAYEKSAVERQVE